MNTEQLTALETTIYGLDIYSSLRIPLTKLMVKVRALLTLSRDNEAKVAIEEMLKILA